MAVLGSLENLNVLELANGAYRKKKKKGFGVIPKYLKIHDKTIIEI